MRNGGDLDWRFSVDYLLVWCRFDWDERCWVVFARGRVSFELEFVGGKVASAPI